MRRTVVVVGSSVGGVRAAQALRTEGFDGRVPLADSRALDDDLGTDGRTTAPARSAPVPSVGGSR